MILLILLFVFVREQVPAEVTRAGPMCMNQLKKQFGASRIPDEPRDRIITPWPTKAKHASVIYKDQIFSVQIVGDNGEVPSIKQLREYVRFFKLIFNRWSTVN
jgi:hypothetical protein